MVLGALTADEAAQTAMPTSAIRSTPGFTQSVYDEILASINAGQITINLGSQCGASNSPNDSLNDLKLASTGSGLALQAVSAAGLAAGPLTAGISIAVASVVAIFSTIFSHHAQAVAKEQAAECALVPAANNYLNIIQQAVASGQQTPAQGIAALQSLQSDFESQISSVMKNTSSSCNAGCVIYKMLEGIVAYQTSVFQDLAAAQSAQPAVTSGNASTPGVVNSGSTLTLPASTTAAAATAAAASSSTSWLGIAALIVGGILLVKVL